MEYIKKMKDWQKFSLKILRYQVSFLVREFLNEENRKIMHIQKNERSKPRIRLSSSVNKLNQSLYEFFFLFTFIKKEKDEFL